MDEINVMRIRKLREEIRKVLPAYQHTATVKVDNESLSAALAIMSELGTYRIMNSVRVHDPVALMKEISGDLSAALKTSLLKHLPEALVVEMFRGPT